MCGGEIRFAVAILVLALAVVATAISTKDSDISPLNLHSKRNSRQARANNDESQLVGGTPLPKVIAVKDNHKPIFKDCLKYRPKIKEEQAVNTYVFTIQAEDNDPPEMGGTVTYKFVSSPGEKERFHVDPESGRITTKDIFDHDEPSREKEAYITVRASDNGQPQLDDACTIKIVIEDINDNAPVFDKVSYSESVPQDLLAGREVMRISATDIDDGNNSLVVYNLDTSSPDQAYFYLHPDNGVIFLNKTIDKPPGYKFKLSAIVKDKGTPALLSSITLDIQVIESNKKSPTFTELPDGPIRLKENFADFHNPIAVIRAVSNIPEEKKLQFELVQGQTEQTNKYHTFLLEPEADSAKIRLGNHLDYEKITDYTLTVRIQNNYKLAAETIINVAVLDVNDNIPIFSGIHSGSVLENEPPGTAVMQVQAFDYDGTTANNQITYELGDSNDPFAIDPITGDITTLKTFDREEHNYYNVKIIATDNAESALIPGKHNSGQQVFLIEISDKNDNRPKFTSDLFVAEAIPENANINELVTQVTALDNDTASLVSYSIVAGNRYDCFVMSSFTGEIRVNQPLDYENVSQFLLDVRANDGIFEDYAKVLIKLENLNDNPPKFMDNYTKIIEEERLYEGCIITVVAFDPDLPDRDGPQNIAYSLVKQEQLKYLNIDNTGCLRLTKPLDRDMPLGFARWQILIMAADHNGKPTDSLRSTTEVILELTDINDNAPFLTNIQPVVWYENQSPGQIVLLTAKDYDSDKNGPPFTFKLNDTSSDIYTKFSIVGNALKSLIRFDREEKKEYNIPVSITDSGVPRMTGVSVLKVVIGDVNDSPMESGSSSIFVYNYKGEAPDMEIGRMYVKDLDDWDLDSKKFKLVDPHPYFEVYASSGTILMRQGTPSGSYFLSCNVSEQNLPYIPLHYVLATVNITVKEIPEEAVDKSGSIRFLNATAEEFILIEQDGSSKKDKLHRRLVQIYNVSYDNVDIFTVANKVTVKDKFLDVRFSAHGSPYYSPEKLNYLILPELKKIEEELGLQIYMVGIDECLIEKEQCEDSCRNVLVKSSAPAAVYTNVTSFVGVSARVESECSCEDTQENFYCLNGGTPLQDKCECPEGYLGPHCQQTMIGFHGDGMAMYKPPVTCVNNHISFYVTTPAPGGMVFYVGTSVYNNLTNVEDFISLEIHNGYPKLLINYGSGVTNLNNTVIQVDDNKPHLIEIVTSKGSIEMFVDRCKLTTCMSLGAPTGNKEIFNANGTEICKFCYHMPLTFVERLQSGKSRAELRQEYLMASFAKSAERALFTLNSSDYNSRDVSLSEVTEILNKNMHDPVGDPSPVLPRPKNPYGSTLKLKLRMTRNMKNERKFVEVEDKPLLISFVAGPLVLGGPHVDYRALASMYDWRHTPSMIPFVGCISNLTINNVVYDLGNPAYHKNADSACHSATSKAISFSIDTNFLIAILVCVAILCILLLAVVVHRRRSDTWAEKELDDIRENIIAYEDEGGGEGDAGYDLHVLRQMYEGRPPESDRYMHTGLVAAAPDLSGFLDDKKSVLDRDADINPLDDVRHYAYEGDGNSSGSLSSLASSGTEEDDQNFTFLTNFGPRFRKLADMYGDDENDRPSGESWC